MDGVVRKIIIVVSRMKKKSEGRVQSSRNRIFLVSLLPTGSEEREVLGVRSIPDTILPSCQYWIIIAQM